MPNGKPANTPCIHLTDDYLCAIFAQPERPQVCKSFTADREMCGDSREEAFTYLLTLEQATSVIVGH